MHVSKHKFQKSASEISAQTSRENGSTLFLLFLYGSSYTRLWEKTICLSALRFAAGAAHGGLLFSRPSSAKK